VPLGDRLPARPLLVGLLATASLGPGVRAYDSLGWNDVCACSPC